MSSPAQITRRYVLGYEYVEDIVERRDPHRQAHLELLSERQADGRVIMAGAVGDPPYAALFVFAEESDAEAFVRDDPYVEAGLVTDWRVEPWNVIAPP